MAERNRNYEIGKPVEHRTLSFYAKPEPEAARIAEGLGLRVAEVVHGLEEPSAPGAPETAVEKRAIWVVHGMGQQVPFETVDALAQGVIKALEAKPRGWELEPPPRVVSTKFSSETDPSKTQVVQRIELKLKRPGKDPNRLELHLYEAYWAPVTEGVAKLSDVLSFLYDGALHGLLNCRKPFRRAMFPGDRSSVISPPAKEGKCDDGIWNFRVRKITAAEIVSLLLLVFALGAINTVVVAASTAKLNFPLFNGWPVSKTWDQLTAIATAVTAMVLTFGAVLSLAEMSRPADAPPFVRRSVQILAWFSLALAAASILIAAVLLTLISRFSFVAVLIQHGLHYHATQFVSTAGILVAMILCALAASRRAAKRAQGEDHREGWFPFVLFLSGYLLHLGLLLLLVLVQLYRFFDPRLLTPVWRYPVLFLGSPFWVWPFLLYLSKQVRSIIVEYPGDVAIYVAPNKLDGFNEARQKIKQLALDSLMPLYSACGASPDAHLYSKIALVGHSLGSVIAYDTLNKLLTLDDLLGNQFGVADRTSILETFGSPLDKTAFFFSYQGTENFNLREQLSACVQPLIQDYSSYRRFPWVNVYNLNDIICGRLKFYDTIRPAKNPPRTYRVINVRDPDASVPLVAHVEYWKNRKLWDILVKRITGP